MIRFEHTTVDFKRGDQVFSAVKDVSLEIKKGEFFGIVGSSGAGKSTLVRTVNLLQRPSSGKVFVNGQDITGFKDRELCRLRLNIGMIFQHFNLIKNANVFDNVAFALKASATPKDRIKGKVFELLDMVGLSDKSEVFPGSLSGGQKQRVAIARALANNPEILLCDEATSALDPDNTKEVIAALKKIKNSYPVTVLFITHQMEVAKNLFDRVAVMSSGKVVECADCYDLFAHPHSLEARNLISKSAEGVLPKQVIEHEKNLYLITFKEKFAYDPVISYVSRNFNLDLSIIAGNIEYIHEKPLGRLLISLRGSDEKERQKALEYIKERAFIHPFKAEDNEHV